MEYTLIKCKRSVFTRRIEWKFNATPGKLFIAVHFNHGFFNFNFFSIPKVTGVTHDKISLFEYLVSTWMYPFISTDIKSIYKYVTQKGSFTFNYIVAIKRVMHRTSVKGHHLDIATIFLEILTYNRLIRNIEGRKYLSSPLLRRDLKSNMIFYSLSFLIVQ